jgi:aspartate-semialdehyde dehydrogenase
MCAAVSQSLATKIRSSRQPDLKSPVVAVVGATGAVGVEMIECLQRRKFPLRSLRLFASARSAGQRASCNGESILIEELREEALDGIDIALFSAGSSISKRFGPYLAERGTIVVDNSSAFRMDSHVPLVVPEINADAIKQHRGIIANPNCAAILSITPLWPVHQINPIKRLIISTYQAASGAGAAAMNELRESTRAHLAGEAYQHTVLPHPYAFNVFSHNTRVDATTGYNEEETKVMQETRKIFGDPTLRITATCVRVPVLRAHCVSINFECEHRISPQQVREIIASAPGVKLVDDPERNYFPMPKDASGRDELLVGRIRQDVSDPSNRSIALFVAGDQLLKGAALNAVQIAEQLLVGDEPCRM